MKSIFRFLCHAGLFIIVLCQLIMTQLLHAQWQQTTFNDGWVISFATIGTNLFVGTTNNDVFLSTDNGTNWSRADSGLPTFYNDVTDLGAVLAASGTNLFAGTADSGVYLSTNKGANWTKVDSGLTNYTVTSLIVSGSNLFAGTFGGSLDFVGTIERWPFVFRSTNRGKSWSEADSGLPIMAMKGPTGITFAVSGTNLFAAPALNQGVYISTNNGTSWTQIPGGPAGNGIYALAVLDTNLFVATDYGVFRSNNNYTNWTQVNAGFEAHKGVYSFATYGTRLFAGDIYGPLYVTYNNGAWWYPVDSLKGNDGFNYAATCLATSGAYLFAGARGVWRRPLSEMDKVRDLNGEKQEDYSLQQNYPNPFNPVTTISFSIPIRSFTSLKVFDIMGREVATIVSEDLQAGTYSRQWNATKMASGVYFYRLQTGSYSSIRKLVLLK